ncbi:MAG: hypothetical protein MJY41_03375 [Bacteroidales bacterium]|nr:hypothetical protein [Bacteroidales bacterium]
MKYKAVIMTAGLWLFQIITLGFSCQAQTIYQYKSDSATVCFFNKSQSQYIPMLMRRYQLGRTLHSQVWGDLPGQAPFMMLTDWEDDGNAGVTAIPHTMIQIGLAPLNMSYFVAPSDERYAHLFKHEYTHVVMTDKANGKDLGWRNFTGSKVVPDSEYPLSSLWGYFAAPRWYAPRWYHEGIACFMETWMSRGFGRALGGYDETYFRTRVLEGKDMFSVVGLETEGNTSDFQQGATSYLYGTRFVNYLVYSDSLGKLVDFYNRTDSSRTYFLNQFKNVYGRNLRDSWQDWQDFEKLHQQKNLEKIAEYPLTELRPMTDVNQGAMSPMIVDEEAGAAFAAVNHSGDFAKVVRYRLDADGRIQGEDRLGYIDGSQMYQNAYLAYDKKGQRLFWTDRNFKMRGLVVCNLATGRTVRKLKYQRMYDICYDNANGYLYGLLSNMGICSLVRYDSSLENREVLYSFPFGVSVSDLDVSHDGSRLVASMLGTAGEHTLVLFDTGGFDDGVVSYTELYSLEDSNLSQFRFSSDDRTLTGFSYYTGVPNAWAYDLETGDFNLLSNVQSGIFAPYLGSDGKVYALSYGSDGMTPVTFDYEILHDANSIDFLGQKAYDAHPDLPDLGRLEAPLPRIEFGEVYDSITVYHPLREMKFQGAYPDIAGFTDRNAWNNVTPVLGYHLAFYDPLSLCSLNLFMGASPWSTNDWGSRFHISASLKYWQWSLKASWNEASFYDLFGPLRRSRKGYQFVLGYDTKRNMQSPFSISWGGHLGHYGKLDALPLYQDVQVQSGITSFQTFDAYINGSKVRSSLGAVSGEQGYRFGASAYSYLAGGKLFPAIDLTWEQGFLLPVGKHNAFWFKGCAGQNFGDSNSTLGNYYFGGFRNNWVDNGTINRYHSLSAMPGAKIDQIGAHNYLKATGEINFSPIRFNNFGSLQCYPNVIQFTTFVNDLVTDVWGKTSCNRANYISAGAQMNIQMVLFAHMTTTLSVGYARIWGDQLRDGELMISLKLL